jgi:hypothetical protein
VWLEAGRRTMIADMMGTRAGTMAVLAAGSTVAGRRMGREALRDQGSS